MLEPTSSIPGGMKDVAKDLAQELCVWGKDGAYTVARTLRSAIHKWEPLPAAALILELHGALSRQQMMEEEALSMTAAVVVELCKEWETEKYAAFVDMLASQHRWGRSSKQLMVLLAEIMGERGIVPATVEAVEEAANIACALRSLHRWEEGDLCTAMQALLPAMAWDPAGLAGLSCAEGGALVIAALVSNRHSRWSVREAATILPHLAPGGTWDGAMAAQMAADLVGKFSMSELEAGQAVHEVMGWEAVSIYTSCELAWRLSSKRFQWKPQAVAALLWTLRDNEGKRTQNPDKECSTEWDALDLSQLADALLERGWEVENIAELVAEFPLAWDMEMSADLLGGLDWGLERTASLLRSLISFESRSPPELATFIQSLRIRHGWEADDVSALVREAMVDANPFTSDNIASCAELSALLESEQDFKWSAEELANLLCSLQAV